MRIKTATIVALPDEVLRCLLLGHAWGDEPVIETTLENGLRAWRQYLTCESCQTQRHDTMAPGTFEIWRRTYYWMPGYGCEEPYDRADLRKERARRAERAGETTSNGQSRRPVTVK